RVSLSVNKQWGSRDPIGNTLAFWTYSDTELGADESPLIYLEDAKGVGTATIRLFGSLAKLAAKERVRVRLPLSSFVGQVESTSDVKFDPAHIRTITILQGLDDGRPHTLFIDDVTIEEEAGAVPSHPAVPTGFTARAYDRHVELAWDRATDDKIRYFKI